MEAGVQAGEGGGLGSGECTPRFSVGEELHLGGGIWEHMQGTLLGKYNPLCPSRRQGKAVREGFLEEVMDARTESEGLEKVRRVGMGKEIPGGGMASTAGLGVEEAQSLGDYKRFPDVEQLVLETGW